MTALALPIGQFFGSFGDVHHVRVLGEVRELDPPRFGVWALLHGLPDKLPDGPWTRAAVLAAAPAAGPVLDDLLSSGLAASVDPGAAGDFARGHRMGHRMLGLGNTSAEPWLFSIGFFGRPVVRVTREVYDLWDACSLAGSLWEACAAVSPSAPDALLADFMDAAHHLLAMSVVYLEPVA
jgi:hypothetical protein